MLGVALSLAALRTLCVPVGSFRQALEQIAPGMTMARIVEILGEPNRICTHPDVGHLIVETDTIDAAGLADRTVERWVYSERRPRTPIPRLDDPECRALVGATELGFEAGGTLLWIARDVGREGLELGASR